MVDKEEVQRSEMEEGANSAFKIVALAASAGGLSALGHVLGDLPSDFPAFVVIVQHLDPRHRSLMAEILGRRTSLQVTQAEEGINLKPAISLSHHPTITCSLTAMERFPSPNQNSCILSDPLPTCSLTPWPPVWIASHCGRADRQRQ